MNSPTLFPISPLLRIYGASHTSEAQTWIALRRKWMEFDWTASWPDNIGLVEETPSNAGKFWPQNLAEIRSSDVVMVLGLRPEPLRGALVEAGAGLAFGARLLLVGQSPSFGTWQHHPRCTLVAGIADAFPVLHEWSEQLHKVEMW